MINTDKYTGHTEGEWRVEPSGINRVMVYTDDECFSYKVSNRNLVADAPLLLAEVLRLRKAIDNISIGMDEDWQLWLRDMKELIK
tara:strand:- start:81 stop:335 length:255 start_codon:yes stop_codon:yes gene_type:complete